MKTFSFETLTKLGVQYVATEICSIDRNQFTDGVVVPSKEEGRRPRVKLNCSVMGYYEVQLGKESQYKIGDSIDLDNSVILTLVKEDGSSTKPMYVIQENTIPVKYNDGTEVKTVIPKDME